MKIDSHHHFWSYDPCQYGWISDSMSLLRRDYLAKDLSDVAYAAGVTGVVSVQARQSTEETEWLLDFARQYELIRGVVGWAPLKDVEVNRSLERWTHFGWLKSLRHVVQDESAGFLDDAEFNRGVETLARYDLAYDILVYAHQLPEVIRFVDRHPNVRLIVDHIAKPSISANRFDRDWEANLRELAKRSNIACKFSGVATEVTDQNWDVETLKPYWEVACECFNTRRLMFGSDWPVCLLRTSYANWVDVCTQLSQSLSDAEQTSFWSGAATEWYQL